MNKVIAFDLDGTLVNSVHHLMPAYRKGFAALHLAPISDELLIQCIGGTLADNHAIVMPEAPLETFMQYELLVAKYAAEYAQTAGQSYPHITEMLDILRQQGYLTVLCSNGTKEYIYPLLKVLELDTHLTHIQALSGEKNKTELLSTIMKRFDSAGHTIMVGDRKFDAEAAKNNHVPFVGCRYGLFPHEVDAAQPDAVLDDPRQLPDIAERLL